MQKRAKKMIGMLAGMMILGLILAAPAVATPSPELKYAPIKGAADVLNDVKMLRSTAKILFVGAHPDDENNALLVYLNRALNADTSYAVSNWGEGGDNWIGQELYSSLGVLRSQELNSSRKFDGATQMYWGAYDFGYSVSLAESLIDKASGAKGIWDPDILAYNLARILRAERPEILFSHHRQDYLDHGQHQANGYLIEKAIRLAADPSYTIKDFDGRAELSAWSVKKFYTSWRPALDGAPVDSADLKIDLGEFDSVLGMSYAESGTLGRNMHKCQNMVAFPVKGSQISAWKQKAAAPGFDTKNNSVFGAIDTSLSAIYACLPTSLQGLVKDDVIRLDGYLANAVSEFTILSPTSIATEMAAAQKTVGKIESTLRKSIPDTIPEKGYALELVNRVKRHIAKVVLDIYGVALDVTVSDGDVHPGQSFDVTVKLWFRGGMVEVPSALFDTTGKPAVMSLPAGWKVTSKNSASTPADEIDQSTKLRGKTYSYTVTVPEDFKDYTGPFNAPYDEYYSNPAFPYGVSKDSNGDGVITWNEMTEGITTRSTDPYSHSPIQARATFSAEGMDYSVSAEPDLRVVPKISVLVSNESAMNRFTGSKLTESTINIIVKNNMKSPANAIVVSAVPADPASGITASSKTVSIASEGQEVAVILNLAIPATFKSSTKMLVSATLGGTAYTEGFQIIDYAHIEKKNYYRAAVQNLTVAGFGLPSDDIRIGYYTTGKDDFVMNYIKLMYNDQAKAAANLKILGDVDLTKSGAALKAEFDTIVVGKMGMSVKPALASNYRNLLDFAAEGGNLVVHYQNWRSSADTAKGKMTLAPVPFYLSGVNINKEDSDVYVFGDSADNRIYTGSNKIALDLDATRKSAASDIWNGWIQQRCEWTVGPRTSDVPAGASLDPIAYLKDLGYSILFQGRDPGDVFDRPAVLYAKIGSGTYTYSSVVWERQLTGLVPGAYKLYANLLSLGWE